MTQINIEFAKFNRAIIHKFKVKHIKHPMRSFLADNLCKIYDESDVSQKTLGKWVVYLCLVSLGCIYIIGIAPTFSSSSRFCCCILEKSLKYINYCSIRMRYLSTNRLEIHTHITNLMSNFVEDVKQLILFVAKNWFYHADCL